VLLHLCQQIKLGTKELGIEELGTKELGGMRPKGSDVSWNS
jgi:hypothetical protein